MTGTRWAQRVGSQLLMLAVMAAPAAAQQWGGELMAMPLEHRVLYQGNVYAQTGTWLGLRVEASVRRYRFELYSLAGTLGGSPDPSNPDRSVRTTTASARLLVKPWLSAGLTAEARRFSSDIAATTWRAIGVVARAETDLGLPQLGGFGELTLYPIAGGTNTVAPSSAARGVIGIRYSPPRTRFMVQLAYRFERFNISDPSSPASRREQFDGLLFGAGVRLGR